MGETRAGAGGAGWAGRPQAFTPSEGRALEDSEQRSRSQEAGEELTALVQAREEGAGTRVWAVEVERSGWSLGTT